MCHPVLCVPLSFDRGDVNDELADDRRRRLGRDPSNDEKSTDSNGAKDERDEEKRDAAIDDLIGAPLDSYRNAPYLGHVLSPNLSDCDPWEGICEVDERPNEPLLQTPGVPTQPPNEPRTIKADSGKGGWFAFKKQRSKPVVPGNQQIFTMIRTEGNEVEVVVEMSKSGTSESASSHVDRSGKSTKDVPGQTHRQ
jgi:hypothetical protein